MFDGRKLALDFLIYFAKLLGLTLGIFIVCGFAVRFCSRAFSRLTGSGSGDVFDITSVIGTPVHELGHALMCLLFAHRIQRIQLWSPKHPNGVYGFVEHSYNRKNPWARLGCLFIGLGPIFSGLAVTVFVLWLCFPMQWSDYLTASRDLSANGAELSQLTSGIFSLLGSILQAFSKDWLRSLLGVLIILPVSLHISLSWQDIKSAVGAIPLYLLMLLIFAGVTMAVGVSAPITDWMWLANVRAMSLFAIVIAFSAVWVLLALLYRFARIFISWF